MNLSIVEYKTEQMIESSNIVSNMCNMVFVTSTISLLLHETSKKTKISRIDFESKVIVCGPCTLSTIVDTLHVVNGTVAFKN
jgi:pyruvate-formate lyase